MGLRRAEPDIINYINRNLQSQDRYTAADLQQTRRALEFLINSINYQLEFGNSTGTDACRVALHKNMTWMAEHACFKGDFAAYGSTYEDDLRDGK